MPDSQWCLLHICRNPFNSVAPDAVTRSLVKLCMSSKWNTDLSRLEEYLFINHHSAITLIRKDFGDGKTAA